MAEKSRFWATNNTGDGLSSGFTVSDWQNFILKTFEGGDEVSGAVLRGVANGLACTGVATPIAVGTGAAIGYGYFYENDASLNLAVTTPTVNITGGHIVLETNWAAQTVRAKMYKNTDGISTPPALTQNAGTLWQTRLCTFTITTGGVIAITDARGFAHFSTEVITAMLKDLSVTNPKLALLSVATGNLIDGAVTNAKLGALAVDNAKMAAGAALANILPSDGAGSLLDADFLDGQQGSFYLAFANFSGQAALAQIANDAIDDTKAGNRVAQFIRRLGGHASDFSIPGNTVYTPTAIRVQWGKAAYSGAAITGGQHVVTFPIAYSQPPFIICGSVSQLSKTTENNTTATTLTMDWATYSGAAVINNTSWWLAIGPE